MNTNEKRQALIDLQKQAIEASYKELQTLAEIYTNVVKQRVKNIENCFYHCKEINTGGGEYQTIETALEELTRKTEEITAEETALENYKYSSDEHIKAEYDLFILAGVLSE